jgi:hypothetical protein
MYYHQCSSVVLTAYIPVLMIGLSIQLITCFVLPAAIIYMEKKLVHYKALVYRKVVKGLLWPNFWFYENLSDAKVILNEDPFVLLDFKSILCFDILNNMVLMFTFGLCSPLLAIAIVCVVISKMKMWLLLIGRFVSIMIIDEHKNMQFTLEALSEIYIPLSEVLKRTFWPLIFCSSFFFAFLCCVKSIWIPIVAIVYPILLFVTYGYVKNSNIFTIHNTQKNQVRSRETELSSSLLSSNTL